MSPDLRWERVAPNLWTLEDESGHIARHIVRVEPHAGKRDPVYRVMGDCPSSDHVTLSQAKAAAEDSLGSEHGSTPAN